MLDQVSGDIGACLAPLDRDDKIFTQPPRGGTGSGDCGEWMWRIPFSPFGEDGAEQCRAAQQKGAHWICGTVGPATGPDGTDGPYEGERTYHAPKMRVQVNGSIVSIDTDAEPAVTRTLETAKANVIYVLQEHGNQPVPLPPHARMTTGKGTVLSAVGLAGGQLTTELPDGRYCIVRRYVREDPLEGNPSPTARTRFHGLPGGYALLEDGDFDNYNLRPDMWNVPFRILFFEVGKFNPQG
ncbi:MAG: hypothetical protein LBJ95_04655 [Oscillospiraceae bacterium]|nr:hypothetical protein [Oscillospiraceae bacterium]